MRQDKDVSSGCLTGHPEDIIQKQIWKFSSGNWEWCRHGRGQEERWRRRGLRFKGWNVQRNIPEKQFRRFRIGKDTYELYFLTPPYSYISRALFYEHTVMTTWFWSGTYCYAHSQKEAAVRKRFTEHAQKHAVGPVVLCSHVLWDLGDHFYHTCLSLPHSHVDMWQRQQYWVINVTSQLLAELSKLLCLAIQRKKQQESNFLFLLPDHLSGWHHYLGRNKNEVI